MCVCLQSDASEHKGLRECGWLASCFIMQHTAHRRHNPKVNIFNVVSVTVRDAALALRHGYKSFLVSIHNVDMEWVSFGLVWENGAMGLRGIVEPVLVLAA